MARLPDPVPGLTGDDLRTYQRMLARRERHGVGLYGPYGPLLHHPQLADRVEQLGGYLMFDGILPRDRSSCSPSPTRSGPTSSGAITSSTRCGPVCSSMRSAPAARDLQDRTVADVGTQGLVEVVALCGVYALMAMVSAAFDVPVTEAGLHSAT